MPRTRLDAEKAVEHVAAVCGFLQKRGLPDHEALLVLFMAAGKLGGVLQYTEGMAEEQAERNVDLFLDVVRASIRMYRHKAREVVG